MILSQNDALQRLAHLWEEDAQRAKRYDPSDPKARVLAACATDLLKVLGETAPEWVSINVVQAWTGFGRQTLARRCREELEPRQEARKVRGSWEILLSVALALPKKSVDRVDPDRATDLDELARIVGRGG